MHKPPPIPFLSGSQAISAYTGGVKHSPTPIPNLLYI